MSDNSLNQQDSPLVCPVGESGCQYLGELGELRQKVAHLAEQVRTDALTGLYNFRYFNDILPVEMERTRRSGQPMSLIVLDIDHFKQFNDRWGHELGNQALVHVAKLINLTVRKLDLACRFGGEEFVVVLPNTDLSQALSLAERLRETIASTPLVVATDAIPVTASLGVDEFKFQHMDSPETLLKRVDAWLYRAKDDGRNRVASPPLQTDTKAVSIEEKGALFGLWDNQGQ